MTNGVYYDQGYDEAKADAKNNIWQLYYDCAMIVDRDNYGGWSGLNGIALHERLSQFFRDNIDRTL